MKIQTSRVKKLLHEGQLPTVLKINLSDARVIEIVTPAERGGQPLPQPAVKLKWRQLHRVDQPDQPLLLNRREDILYLEKAR